MSNTPLNADEQQYRFAHNPLAHQLFHTFRAMVTKKGVDAALADIAEAQAADRKKHELQARLSEGTAAWGASCDMPSAGATSRSLARRKDYLKQELEKYGEA